MVKQGLLTLNEKKRGVCYSDVILGLTGETVVLVENLILEFSEWRTGMMVWVTDLWVNKEQTYP